MSHHDYTCSREIAQEDHTFYALVMAAMRKADTDNLARLRDAFPLVYQELWERYGAPGGWLQSDLHIHGPAGICERCGAYLVDGQREPCPGRPA